MNSFFRHILLTFCAIVCFLSARADGNITFEINTPLIVTAGEMFRVEFVLENGKPDDGKVSAPDFAGLDVLAGPTVSTGHSFSSINGVSSSKSTYKITYVVTAQTAGNITIGAAKVEVDGKA